jgi:hypothetical protein
VVAVNQDPDGAPFFRVDDGGCFHDCDSNITTTVNNTTTTTTTTATTTAANAAANASANATGAKNTGYTQARLAECGGEPDLQKWLLDKPAKGFVSSAKVGPLVPLASFSVLFSAVGFTE